MTVKLGYKQSEVGVIPDDWDAVNLQTVCSMKSGESITSANIDGFSKYPCFGGNGLRGYTKRFTHDGAFALIGRQGALCGNVVRAQGRFFASEHAVVVTAQPGTDVAFLTYVLGRMRLNRFSESSAQPGLSVSKVLKLALAVPPNEAEQRSIATALTDVDDLLTSLDRLIAKKRAIKQGVMHDLLTGRKRLPGFSGEWPLKPLGELAELHRTTTLPATRPETLFTHFSLPAYDAGIPLPVESGHAIGSAKFMVPQDAILVSKLNPRIPRTWKPLSIPPHSVASTEWLVLTPRTEITRDFLFVACQSPAFTAALQNAITGTTGSHQRVNPSTALTLLIALPPLPEQATIAAVLADLDDEIDALQARRDKTHAIKQAMMHELLTGRTRLV